MKELVRTKINDFELEDAITIDEIRDNISILDKKIITIEAMFDKKKKIELNERKKELFLNGVRLNFKKPDDIYKIYNNNQFIGLGIIKDNLLKRDVIL